MNVSISKKNYNYNIQNQTNFKLYSAEQDHVNYKKKLIEENRLESKFIIKIYFLIIINIKVVKKTLNSY